MSRAIDDTSDKHRAVVEALERASQLAAQAGIEYSYAAMVELKNGSTGVVAHMGPRTSALAKKAPDMYEGAIAFLFQTPSVQEPERLTEQRGADGELMSTAHAVLADANDGMTKPQ